MSQMDAAADQLRADIAMLRAVLDAAIDADKRELVEATSDLLRARRDELEALEAKRIEEVTHS